MPVLADSYFPEFNIPGVIHYDNPAQFLQLVTGGAGFVGTNLIKRLLKDGHDVSSLDNYSTGLKSNEVEGCRYWVGDIQHISTMDTDFDVVFHMAAIARIQPSFEMPEDYINTKLVSFYLRV